MINDDCMIVSYDRSRDDNGCDVVMIMTMTGKSVDSDESSDEVIMVVD